MPFISGLAGLAYSVGSPSGNERGLVLAAVACERFRGMRIQTKELESIGSKALPAGWLTFVAKASMLKTLKVPGTTSLETDHGRCFQSGKAPCEGADTKDVAGVLDVAAKLRASFPTLEDLTDEGCEALFSMYEID